MKFKWSYVTFGAAAGAVAGFYFRNEILELLGMSTIPERRVNKKLPLAKNLKTIPDFEGNYDIDGVSYDTEGTIVSSDQNKQIHAPI